jgi:hypothetical protein
MERYCTGPFQGLSTIDLPALLEGVLPFFPGLKLKYKSETSASSGPS